MSGIIGVNGVMEELNGICCSKNNGMDQEEEERRKKEQCFGDKHFRFLGGVVFVFLLLMFGSWLEKP